MEPIILEVNEAVARKWPSAPTLLKEEAARLVEQFLLLKGEVQPTGTDKLTLAIDLAEAGFPSEVITNLTQLMPEVFEAFIKK